MWLLPLLGLLACPPPVEKPDDSDVRDTSRPRDTAPPPDACDGTPGQVICIDNTAVACDASGDVTSETACGDTAICITDTGCSACSVDVSVDGLDETSEDLFPAVLLPTDPDAIGLPAALLGLRPVTLSVPTAGTTGIVRVDMAGAGVTAWTATGGPVLLPVEIPATALPFTWYLGGSPGGAATLTATLADRCASPVSDAVELEVAPSSDLAGGALDRFPHFVRFDAVNAGSPVQTALDPWRFPDRVGATADIWVVRHRTPTEWGDDPTLLDVTGTVERVTVVAGSIVDNLVEAWAVADPPATVTGDDLDVVWDFGLDGRLDPGDLVDGLSWDRPGLRVVGDLSAAGPLAVTTVEYSGGPWKGQRTYYPTDLSALGLLPLVVVSHGNGHDYTWYDWLGEHLASHGYVVMSHQNNTGPGIETASTTTLDNTDWLLANLATIAGGVLQDHVDPHTIVWVGHSRGGEGVVRAYDRLVDGDYVPTRYTAADVALLSSIAPTVFNEVDDSDPHDVPYHLLAGAADGDVTGGADCPQCQFFRIAQAARGPVHVTYVQGASHNDFNCCGFKDGTGPDLIGPRRAQVAARAYYLALLEATLHGDPVLHEYLDRMYDDLRPSGIDATVTLATTARERDGVRILDDAQAESDPARASGGGTVTWSGLTPEEGVMNDGDTRFSWSDLDSMNGMTQASERLDTGAGVLLQWDEGTEAVYDVGLPSDLRDLTAFTWLSLRAAQQTRHPNTVALDAPLTFTVALVDGTGAESAIDFGAWGALTTPYKRTGLGPGEGWANEFSTVRLRLSDFETDGAPIDLTDIVTVRLRFGAAWGSPQGRIGLDDVELIP